MKVSAGGGQRDRLNNIGADNEQQRLGHQQVGNSRSTGGREDRVARGVRQDTGMGDTPRAPVTHGELGKSRKLQRLGDGRERGSRKRIVCRGVGSGTETDPLGISSEEYDPFEGEDTPSEEYDPFEDISISSRGGAQRNKRPSEERGVRSAAQQQTERGTREDAAAEEYNPLDDVSTSSDEYDPFADEQASSEEYGPFNTGYAP